MRCKRCQAKFHKSCSQQTPYCMSSFSLRSGSGATFMGQSQVGKKADSKPAGGLNLGPKP